MFTGIIQHVGSVTAAEKTAAGRRLWIDVGPLADELGVGASVAVNGACVTAAEIDGHTAGFDVVPETLERTAQGELATGRRVNLERALRVGDRLDGHIVQGHVDGTAGVDRVDRSGGQWCIHFACERALTDEMVAKGSVAVDGVSLTLASAEDGRFSVAVIPTTLAKTTLADRRAGDRVNVETDVLGKYVRRMLRRPGSSAGGVTLAKLGEAGFI